MGKTAFQEAVDCFAERRDVPAIEDLILLAKQSDLADGEIAHLARVLASSGDVWDWDGEGPAADIASTGGPSSLSTLLCPLYLRNLGLRVPKLGVPGRPAGAIDVLGQIPGYRTRLTTSDAKAIYAAAGFVNLLTTDHHAPLDGQLFAYRRSRNAVAVPALAIASLLSKKLAVGLKKVGLDIRVAPHGNFGGSWKEAGENGLRFKRVASLLDIEAKCFLTDGTQPSQPYVGRGESLLALDDLFSGRAGDRLDQHARRCLAMARAVAAVSSPPSVTGSDIRDVFHANLRAQGSDGAMFDQRVRELRNAGRRTVTASSNGFLSVDLSALRAAIVAANEPQDRSAPLDPIGLDLGGVILARAAGDFVFAGDPLAYVREPAAGYLDVASAFRVAAAGSQDTGYEEL